MKTPGLSALSIAPLASDIFDVADVEWVLALKTDGTWGFVPYTEAVENVTDLCAAIGALNTVTDTEVPITADIPYRRADNSCGRAPLPKLRGFITTRALAVNGNLAPATDEVVLLDTTAGTIALSLVTPAAGENRNFILKKTNAGANAVTATPASGTIDGGANLVFGASARTSVEIMWDGTNWHIVSAS